MRCRLRRELAPGRGCRSRGVGRLSTGGRRLARARARTGSPRHRDEGGSQWRHDGALPPERRRRRRIRHRRRAARGRDPGQRRLRVPCGRRADDADGLRAGGRARRRGRCPAVVPRPGELRPSGRRDRVRRPGPGPDPAGGDAPGRRARGRHQRHLPQAARCPLQPDRPRLRPGQGRRRRGAQVRTAPDDAAGLRGASTGRGPRRNRDPGVLRRPRLRPGRSARLAFDRRLGDLRPRRDRRTHPSAARHRERDHGRRRHRRALEADSICVHGDTPDAVALARAARDALGLALQ